MSAITWKLDSEVFGMVLLTVSPGFSHVGTETSGKRTDLVVRAGIESTVLGIGAVLITRSWWPLLGPFLYLAWEHSWDRSSVPQQINNTISADSEEETENVWL